MPQTERERERRRLAAQRSRAKRKAQHAMDSLPPVTPDLVLPDPVVAPPGPGAGAAPRPAPLPSFADEGPIDVPAYQPFRYDGQQPLTPLDLDVISTFHATYMQGAGIGGDRLKFRQAQRDALIVLPLMQKQYTLACVAVDGPHSQEAQQVKRNVEWVEQLLTIEG